MRIKLLHKLWELVFVAPSKLRGNKRIKRRTGTVRLPHEEAEDVVRGDCDDPESKRKQIRVADNLPMQEEMEVVIHECLHACDWWKDEVWIGLVAEDVAHVLVKRLGWIKLGTPEAEKLLRKLGWSKETDEQS